MLTDMAQEDGHGMGSVYRPTSLDFINRPNPVEPQSVPQKHPLNGTPQVSKPSNQDLLRLALDRSLSTATERPHKRRKSSEGKLLDLPKLPVRHGTKRLRIPPTLSGLHHPPPDAGILPSISVEQPVPDRKDISAQQSAELLATASEPESRPTEDPSQHGRDKAVHTKPKRKKWSDDETADLLLGVARFGIGNWTKILKCSDYHFQKRTALDLKDRFRVCCPDEYNCTEKRSQKPPSAQPEAAATTLRKPPKSDRKSESELRDLGISQPFVKTKRRKRHGYSAAEDEALLRGFGKYGNSWAAIRADETLCLEHRTPTDLRDRMRTKFPDQYANAGLARRPGNFPKPSCQRDGLEGQEITPHGNEELMQFSPSAPAPLVSSVSEKYSMRQMSTKKQQPQIPPPPFEDPYFGAPFENYYDIEPEPVTLDRRILDWPSDLYKTGNSDASKVHGIDPLATLNLPRPPLSSAAHTSTQSLAATGSLPSLAAITALSDSNSDQLELPSLLAGPWDSDGRVGGHFLGFNELLS